MGGLGTVAPVAAMPPTGTVAPAILTNSVDVQARRDAALQALRDGTGSPAAAPVQQPDYRQSILADATKQYPFISQYNPIVTVGQGNDAYAETWAADEPGDQSYPRPKDIPLGRFGVQVFKPEAFRPADLAAEFLHVDPIANETRDRLLKSMTPAQIQKLKQASNDYAESIKLKLGEQRAIQNAVDSALRGYTTGQWPDEANAQMQYTPAQKQMLDGLRGYMTTGQRPADAQQGKN